MQPADAPAVEQLESQSSQPCAEAITRLELEGGGVADAEVFVTNAEADVRGGGSAFLSLEPEGWRLSAVGCTREDGPPQDVPLDGELEAWDADAVHPAAAAPRGRHRLLARHRGSGAVKRSCARTA